MSWEINDTDATYDYNSADWKDDGTFHAGQYVPPGLILSLRVALGCLFCIGVVGNVLTIVSIALTRSLHSVPNIYLCNLAASDLTLCAVAMPTTFISYTLEIPVQVCEVLANAVFTCIMVSLTSITMVAVNRYVLVVLPHQYYVTIYTTKNVRTSIAAIWFLGTLYGLPPHFGFGRYEYNEDFGGCFASAHSANSWLFVKIVGGGLSLFPAMVISLFCYVSICITFRLAKYIILVARRYPSRDHPATFPST